jgi:WD40 repeat protein
VRLQATNSNTAPDLVISIINDTLSLLGEYYDPIRIAPLAVYQSALLFMPCCALYVVACDDLQDVRLLSPRKPIWTSDTLIFQRECYGNLLPIAVSPDDSVVAAVNWNQPYVGVGVTVWKTSTGQVLNTWSSNTPHVVLVQAIAFSLDGKQLAIITLDSPRVHWWEPHTGMCRIQPIDLKISSGFRDSKYGRVPSHSVISEGGSRLVVGFSHGIDDVSLQAVDLDTGETRVLLCDLAVTSVAVSQDASRIASSSDDGSLRVWNAHDGILLSILNGFGRPAVVLAFTPRHNIVAMTNDGAVRIGGVESGGLVFVLRDSEDSVEITGKISRAALYSGYYNANAISASARSPLVAVATSKFVSVWNEETRQRVAQRQLYTSPSKEYTVNSAVAFMSHRPGLIVAPSQEAMSLWNFQTQWQTAEAPPFDMLGGAVNSVKFSHEGCFVISGSDDPDLRIWETSSGVLTATIRTGHTHPVIGAAFALRDRSLVLSGSDGGQDMELREVRASGLLKRLDASSRWQYTYQLIAFSRDGSQFATMTRETGWNPVLCKVLRLYESNTGKVLAEERLGESVEFTEISFLPNGSRIIAICSSFMKSWSTLKQSPLCDSRTTKAEEPRRDSFLSFACSPDSARIVSISPNCNIHVWDAHTDEKIRSTSYESLDIETSPPVIWLCAQYVVHYSPTTSGRFLSCSWAGVVRIWNDDTLDMENIFTAVDLSPNSRSFHTVYSMITACYSPDGATVAVAVEHFLRTFSRYLEVRVHDTSTGQTIKSLVPITRHPVHEDPGFKSDLEAPDIPRILSLNFSPDGQYVFSLRGGCHRVEVWSVISGEHMGSLPSPLRTCWAALSVCPITARLFVTCNPKSIAQRVAEAAEVSAELVAQSGLVGDDATNMCLSIVQDLFEADQTYLCVWDTHSFHLQSTLRCGNDGLGLPHFCIDQDSRSLLRKPLPRYHTIPIVRQIPRLYRPRFALSPDGWITFISSPDRWVAFILKPDGWSTRHYDVENGEDKDVRMSIRVCNIPPNRRPPTNLLLRSHNCTWGPVASHGHIVAIGSLKGLVSIIDLTSLMLKLERKINLQQPGRDQR